jgi:hypothetical protein
MPKVVRIAAGMALLVVFAAGCGSATGPHSAAVHGIPRALAQDWEGRASAIADAASAGNSCRALQLAASLRHDVVTSEHEVPLRLRLPLRTGVNALADRITCTPAAKPKPPEHPPKKPKPKPPRRHGPHGHDEEDHQ